MNEKKDYIRQETALDQADRHFLGMLKVSYLFLSLFKNPTNNNAHRIVGWIFSRLWFFLPLSLAFKACFQFSALFVTFVANCCANLYSRKKQFKTEEAILGK